MQYASTPETIRNISKQIEALVGHEKYMELEEMISVIMNIYEERGFETGFKAGARIMVDLVK